MANKKTGGKTQRKTGRAQTTAKRTSSDADKMRVTEIAIVAVSVIFFCLAVISGDGVWNVLHGVYVGIFGLMAACIFPLISIVVTIFYSAKSTDNKSRFVAKIIEGIVMVFIIAGFIHIVKNQPSAELKEALID
ncbi:MAG: hypothetical protein ACI4RR_05345, partial [Eubacterium sp.]